MTAEHAAPVRQNAAPQTAPPQDVRVGVIGVGRMGADHVERITRRIKGARVSVLSDYLRETAEKVSQAAPGSRVVDTWQEVVAAEDVDAVLIASPGEFHREQVLACIEAGKPVLCEKPLAMNPSDAYDVVRAEAEAGTPLVSLGFMRRFDVGYGELKDALEAGELGTPMSLNCKHRNASVPPGFTDTHMVYDSAVHEIDAISFFLEEPVVSVQTVMPRGTEKAPEGPHDPRCSCSAPPPAPSSPTSCGSAPTPATRCAPSWSARRARRPWARSPGSSPPSRPAPAGAGRCRWTSAPASSPPTTRRCRHGSPRWPTAATSRPARRPPGTATRPPPCARPQSGRSRPRAPWT
ncbi:Gfo/Idh/MocA family oxidoreductase [Brachybacterium sp. GPGPB12]|uniref:Gfo/Idh/MocA family protein n=1 Tax=Brachybacterium sp. GPGPB12 TaxID=3023517 RepID=UPI0031344485